MSNSSKPSQPTFGQPKLGQSKSSQTCSNVSLPDFDDVANMFWRLGVMQSPSQLQGYLVGRLVLGETMAEKLWIERAADYMDAVQPPDEQESQLLQALYAAADKQLSDGDMALQMLLPDDAVEITQRIDSLAQWCQGFMVGFAEAGKIIQQQRGQQQYSQEVSEALSDMAAISQVSLGEGDDDADQREQNFFEISEYLRLAALTIYLGCREPAAARPQPAPADEETLGSVNKLFQKRDKKLH